MVIGGPLPRGQFPIYHESSSMRPMRDGDATAKNWKKNSQVRSQSLQIQNSLSQTNRAVQKLQRRVLGMAPLPNSFNEYHPFKIYQPDLTLLTSTGTTFDATGQPLEIAIDSTVPTNLPHTVNPTTDAWRFWAIREGLVSQRAYDEVDVDHQAFFPGVSAVVNLSDFSTSIQVDGCDTVGIGFQQGLPYEFDPSSATGAAPVFIQPIVLPDFGFDIFGVYNIGLFVQINGSQQQARITAHYYVTTAGDAFPTPLNSSFIPIGVITLDGYNFFNNLGTNATDLTAYQIQYGNVINRYGIFENANPTNQPGNDNLYYSANLNFRGNWFNDPIQGLFFYPGDVIQYQRELDFTTSDPSITVSIDDPDSGDNGSTLYVQQLYMATVVCQTTEPAFDSNFVQISGVSFDPNNQPTPNTT